MREAIALINRYYAAFNAGDMETFLSLLTEDVAHDINQGERQAGKPVFARIAFDNAAFISRMSAVTIVTCVLPVATVSARS